MVKLPRSSAIHSSYLRTFLDDDSTPVSEQSPIALVDPNCVFTAVNYAVAYMKVLCDAMHDLPGSGYTAENGGRSLIATHLPSIYTYLGRGIDANSSFILHDRMNRCPDRWFSGTNRTPWEQALRAYTKAIGDLPDALLVQIMHTANFLDVKGMMDAAILQISVRIEKETDHESTRQIGRLGGDVLVKALISLSTEYIIVDEELALQFVRALTALVPLGFAEEIKTFNVLSMPEVARCHPLENEIARALHILTAKFGLDTVLERYVLLFDNPDWPVRRFGLKTFLSTDMSSWTPKCIETIVRRLKHGNAERRLEAFRALRKQAVGLLQNEELPQRIRDTLIREALLGTGHVGMCARRMVKDQVANCFFRDDDGQMLLRDKERWWSLAELMLRSMSRMECEDWPSALSVKPDDPHGPFRQLLEHLLPTYCQHVYAKDHLVEEIFALHTSAGGIWASVRNKGITTSAGFPPYVAPEETATHPQRNGDNALAVASDTNSIEKKIAETSDANSKSCQKQTERSTQDSSQQEGTTKENLMVLRSISLLALCYAVNPLDKGIRQLLAQAAGLKNIPSSGHDRREETDGASSSQADAVQEGSTKKDQENGAAGDSDQAGQKPSAEQEAGKKPELTLEQVGSSDGGCCCC
eukprot:763255-Hanusia_phi.AAC.1